jgi:hypothetical protein
MTFVSWKGYLPVCFPLALMACSNDQDRPAQMDARVPSPNRKSDQTLAVAQQAQDGNVRTNQQFQRSLQK